MFGFTFDEVRDLVIAAVVLAFLFGYPFANCSNLACYAINMIFFILVVSTAFLGHEIAHKITSQHFGSEAKFKMWPTMLFGATALRILIPQFPVFAAPGAVVFSPFSSKHFVLRSKQVGLISLAGPLANVVMGVLFYFFMPGILGLAGANVNFALALFNMWPIGPLDGAKVMKWDFKVWGLATLGVILLQMGLA